MDRRFRGLLVLALASLTLGACGSSSSGDGNATTLLMQTFSGSHVVGSGDLSVSLTVTPTGSSTIRGPISLSFGGPFQSLGKGKLPASDFTVRVSALGKTGSLGILSTGTTGYVSLQGASYELPAATFRRLESSFAQIGASPGGAGAGSLSALGIDPLRWLVHPSVVGRETVAGTSTTHIRAGIDVVALLADIDAFLSKASSLGVSSARSLPRGISDRTRSRVAGEVENPSFELWTGNGDKTVRKISIRLTLPVGGHTSSALGGLRSADVGLTLRYADLGRPQSINAPAGVRPFSEFQAKLQTFLAGVQGSLVGSSASSSTAASASKAQVYSQCLQSAGRDVAKMQSCAALVNK